MTPIELPAPSVTFRDFTWKTKWIFVGFAFVALWQAVRFLDREWVSRWTLGMVLVALLVPFLFTLLFPFLTRDRDDARPLCMPSLQECFVEWAIAVGLVITILVLAISLQDVVAHYRPGGPSTSHPAVLNPFATRTKTYLWLLTSFTLAPLAEEIFFRGFFYNAFRRRMPIAVAMVLQSLIFGLAHIRGATDIAITCVMGLVLTCIYEWRKTLLTPILVHAGINLVGALAVLAAMSAQAERPAIGILGNHGDTECIVREVVPNSPAVEAGILVGDRILTFDGQPVSSIQDFAALAGKRRVGEAIVLTLVRDGELMEADVVLKRAADLRP